MKYCDSHSLISRINSFSSSGKKFAVFIDFAAEGGYILTPEQMKEGKVSFSIRGVELGYELKGPALRPEKTVYAFPSFEDYSKSFSVVSDAISRGDTYLLNLTSRSETVFSSGTPGDLYAVSDALYKAYFPGKFIFHSPETFIRIKDGRISAFPMKGTFRYSPEKMTYEDASAVLMSDEKELYEHYTIVDLLRNDLAMVSKKVKVDRFRYVDMLKAGNDIILQTSSEISGVLDLDWKSSLGNLLFKLLPAGSVTGAPKKKTVEIIRAAEPFDRGYYTGICGYFDGESFDSAVMIRLTDITGNRYFYHSGGGITFMSKLESEYGELKAKVY